MSGCNYNTDPLLLENARESYRKDKIFIQVVDGHVVAGHHGVIARFDDDAAAIACLTTAGYEREPNIQSIIFWP